MCMPKLEYLKKEKTTVNVFVRTFIYYNDVLSKYLSSASR